MMNAKRMVLEKLKKEMRDGDDVGLASVLPKKMSKVTVAAKDPEDLVEGLDKAQEILKKRKELLGSEDSEKELSEEEETECPEEIVAEDSSESEEAPVESEETSIEDLKQEILDLKAELSKVKQPGLKK